MSNLEIFGLLGLGVAVALQWPFVALFATGGPWWADFVGRAIMSKSAVIAVALSSSLFHALAPPYPHELAVRVTIAWLIAVVVAYQLYALLRQRHGDRQWGRRARERVERTSPEPRR
jgi:hypothetical protein